jgi:hypothetical protein
MCGNFAAAIHPPGDRHSGDHPTALAGMLRT